MLNLLSETTVAADVKSLLRIGHYVVALRRLLNFQCQLQHSYDVRSVLIDPGPIVLADHIPVGMPHLLRYPVDRRYPCGQ